MTEPLAALRRIGIRDNGEPLVDILTFAEPASNPKLLWAPEHPVFQYERERRIREGVARMLGRAAALLSEGTFLQIVEGWRSPEAQRMMYRATWEEMRRRHPGWSDASLRRQVNRYSAPPDHSVPPPHLTGGAVDLHLVRGDGQLLDFTSPFAITDRASAAMQAEGISDAARGNRALLSEVLTAVGLTNYADEWWHWSYGDQGWALRTGAPVALYGPVGLEEPSGNSGS